MALKEPRYNYEKFYQDMFNSFDVITLRYKKNWTDEFFNAVGVEKMNLSHCDIVNESPGVYQIELIRLISPIISSLINFEKLLEMVNKEFPQDVKFWGINADHEIKLINTFGAINKDFERTYGISISGGIKNEKTSININEMNDNEKAYFCSKLMSVLESCLQ